MAHSIFARQDSTFLDRLFQASVITDTEPDTLLLQIWVTSKLPRGWLNMLSFEVSDDNGNATACCAEYLGTNAGAECFTLKALNQEVDLASMFKVEGDEYCLGIQYVDVVTMDGGRKRLSNEAKSLKAFPCADIVYFRPPQD